MGDKWRALFGDDKQAEVTVTERTRRVGGGRSRARVAGAAPVAADIDEVMRAHARRHRRGLLMRQTQLILGDFPLTMSTAEYDRLGRGKL